jgi:DNA mismatch repair protein MutS2
MGLSNIPVPAAEGSSLPTWNRVYVLLGDQQSLEDSLSTFTAQIDSLSRYWGNIDESSLVIMDEFGAGTDPTQGAALAQSVLDSLLKRGAWAMAATHFPALKAHALAAVGVRSASVLFDPGTKRPLFRLAYDQAGESRALNVARERGLPAEILERAEKYLLLEGSDGSAVMDRLNELAVNRERELERLEAERRRLEEKRGKLAENFEREKEKLLREMKAGSQEIVRQWQQGRKSRKKALSDLAALREKVAAAGDETESPRAPQGPVRLDMDTAEPGMRVRYEAFGKEGVIRERDERKGQVKVDMDGVSMWVAASDLTAPGRRSGEKTGGMSYESAGGPGGLYLDLRGFRADEARQELLRFLDRAVLSGHDSLEVVHGKGTGALRREVRDVLQNSPVVSNFELGPEDAGGDGMTKVQLR